MIRTRALLLSILLLAFPAWCDRNSEWLEDLDFLYAEIKKNHISPFVHISEKDFVNRLSLIKENVQGTTDFQITLELMRLVRQFGDGHTAVHFYQYPNLKKLPIDIYNVSGAWKVLGIENEHKALLGAEITHIGQHEIKAVQSKLSQLAQFVENKNSFHQRSAQYAIYSELLYELGITDSPDNASLTFLQDNKPVVVTLKSGTTVNDLVRLDTNKPNLRKVQDAGIEDVWFAAIEKQNAVYVKFGRYPSFEKMDQFGQSLLSYIKDNQVKNLIIDLRGNWGGDFYVGVWLAYYLNLADSLDWNNGVYTLIDKDTFSAATINAAQFKQLLNAKIVGEPTGSNPHGVQDMGTFKLPHSGLTVSYSKRMFRLQKEPNTALLPDFEVKYSWESYVAGEDNILMWVLSHLKSQESTSAAKIELPRRGDEIAVVERHKTNAFRSVTLPKLEPY